LAASRRRAFILGVALAHQSSAGFVPIRKRCKLPHTTVTLSYSLDNGSMRWNSRRRIHPASA